MKRIITVFFVCLFSVLLMVGATTSSAAEISSSSDYFNYKATYIKDYCTYDYLVNEMRLPYRSFVETLNQDAAFQTELAAWELVNISPDLLVAQITDTKQCKYYEAIIMDLLVRDTQEASFAENMQSMKDLIHVNAWKTFINFNNEISKDTPITSENSMSLLKDMKMAGIFSDILEGADTVIDSAVNIKDLFDKLSKIETIRRMSKSYALVLDQMSNQCNDIYLTAAINNVKMFFSDNLTIDQIKSIVVLESTSSTVYTAFMENVKKMVVKSMGLTGMSVSLAQSAGTAVSNTLFGTGNMVSDYYQMSALYEIEDLLRSSLKITSGGTFCAAFKMYENICLMGCDYSKKYVEPLHTSLFGKLFSWATNQNYENYSKQLDDLKSQISFMFNMIDVGADSWYIIDTGNAQNMSDVNSFYRTSNYAKSEYTEKSESIRTNVYGTYGSNNGDDITLNGNLEIYNDFKITGGKLDLNGYKLTINGNLLQSGGEMYINGGTLEVSGDYRIQSYTKNSSTDEMEYTSSSGYLNMTKTKDLVKVKGSFFTQSSMAGFNTLEAGTMEIGGDFKQIGDSDGNFAASGTHTVIFNGTKTQHISFDSTSSYFNNLEATNYNISWSNYLYVNSFESNVNINSDEVIVRYINLNGKDVSINGDVTAVGETDISQGRLAINGNLLQSGGEMYINGGTLEVSGDYRIQSYTKNSSTDEMEYTSSSGYLNMTKTKDLVKVKGSFFTQSSMGGYNTLEAGTMKIGGDFKQIQDNSSGNFAARGTHTVIFNGTKTQHISFDSSSSYFSDVDFQNPDISFDSGIQGWTLRRDTAVNGNMELKRGTCDLNGYKLTINGNLLQSGGEMYINGGTLEVSGDYRIQSYTKNSSTDEMEYTSSSGYLNMTKTKDLVKVKGSFFTQSSMGGYNKLEAGTMEIGGDFKQIGDNASYNNFAASGTHTVIFNGTKTQHISFDSTSSHFNNLKLIKDKENDYVIKPDNCWKTLYLDTCVNNVVIVSDVTSLKPKESYTMYARVDGINKPSQEVMWTVTGNTDTQTTFSENGVLTIGTNEKADKITVTAVSIEDSTKSASIDIHIEIPVPIVIGVKITPTVVSLANGDTYNFVADVYGLYSPSQNVEWTISGNQSDKTKIDVNGNLTVAKDESSNKIVVMATAVADRTKSTGVEVNIIQVKIIPTVVNVTVTNTTAIMAVGGSQTLKAIVTGSNNPSQDVTWSVSGNNSVDTVISKDGILTIAKNETTSALVVCATSVANPKKYGEFVIEISNSGDLKDLRGDVSGDGKVSIVDAVVAARYILGSVELDESQIDRTDINGDGKITLADVIMIQRIMM